AGADVQNSRPNLAVRMTAHRLIIIRYAIFQGGIRPHLYCLPIAKRETHRRALRRAATSGHPAFFLGTDSAPHAIPTKETACGCAGVFTAVSALELYAEVFAEDGALDKFEAFASLNGPAFYRLPLNNQRVTLCREEWSVPARLGEASVPYETLAFRPAARLVGGPAAIRRAATAWGADLVHAWMSRAASFVPARMPCPVIGWMGEYYNLKYFTSADYLIGVTQ